MTPTTHINRLDLINAIKSRRTKLFEQITDLKAQVAGLEIAIDVAEHQNGTNVPPLIQQPGNASGHYDDKTLK